MIPVDQTVFSARDGSVKGNCFPACLASLLELPLESVPAFQTMERWHDPFWDFISAHGYEFEGTFWFEAWATRPARTWPELEAACAGVDGLFIVGGPSPREYVAAGHAVIYGPGGRLVHDPHPSRGGILELHTAMMIVRAPKS